MMVEMLIPRNLQSTYCCGTHWEWWWIADTQKPSFHLLLWYHWVLWCRCWHPEIFISLTVEVPNSSDGGLLIPRNLHFTYYWGTHWVWWWIADTQKPSFHLLLRYPIQMMVDCWYPETFSPLTGAVPIWYDGGDADTQKLFIQSTYWCGTHWVW